MSTKPKKSAEVRAAERTVERRRDDVVLAAGAYVDALASGTDTRVALTEIREAVRDLRAAERDLDVELDAPRATS